jgi:glutathionylspermidine synthase
MKVTTDNKLPKEFFQNICNDWMVSPEIGDYVQSDTIHITEEESDEYYAAANELYDMFIRGGDVAIKYKLYDKMGIDKSLIPMIEHSWEHDNNWHLYGRFDLAGGLDGKEIKLIEFNADTATSLPECGLVQWAHLKYNERNENNQFNRLFEAMVMQFNHMAELNPNKERRILFTYMDSTEDKGNVEFLAEAALEAGFEIEYRHLDEIHFVTEEGSEGVYVQFDEDEWVKYDYWFKLIPWEFLVEDTPDLIPILTDFVVNDKCVILNPAYTMLFQSKAMLKILWDLYPDHPLLLETQYEPIEGDYVEKVIFGREGANVKIITDGDVLEEKDGEYGDFPKIYQRYFEMNSHEGKTYQAGVFYGGEGCGLCYRRGSKIMNDTAEFVSHYVEKNDEDNK